MRITVQLYTVRNELAADTAGTLKALGNIGLEYVELGGLTPASVQEWKPMLDDAGLKTSGAHYMLAEYERADEMFEVMRTLGSNTLIVPWVPHETFATLDSIKKFADDLNAAGSKARAAGFEFLYHNHDFEFAKIDGKGGWYHLAELTDPEIVGFEVDMAWVKIGGEDEVAILDQYSSRIGALHLKDMDVTKTPRWTVAGEGTVNLKGGLAFGTSHGIPFGAIELDESPMAPIDAVKGSFEYFKSLGYC